ncbi:hypothetical protein JTB14_015477 [Gonioctena quinquepunctata]|nr:hypothetical protein JTB14_015477 [Gonioctena quinquepunctata]
MHINHSMKTSSKDIQVFRYLMDDVKTGLRSSTVSREYPNYVNILMNEEVVKPQKCLMMQGQLLDIEEENKKTRTNDRFTTNKCEIDMENLISLSSHISNGVASKTIFELRNPSLRFDDLERNRPKTTRLAQTQVGRS